MIVICYSKGLPEKSNLIGRERQRRIKFFLQLWPQHNQPTPRLNHGPLPSKEYLLKFKLVAFLENVEDEENNADDVIVDYVVVYGEEINSLIVQTFAKPVKTGTGLAEQVSTL